MGTAVVVMIITEPNVCIPDVTVQENGRRLKPASGREEIFTGGLP